MNAIQQLIIREQKDSAAHISKGLPPRGGVIVLLGEGCMGKTNTMRSVFEQLQPPFAMISLASFDNEVQFYEAILESLSQYLPVSETVIARPNVQQNHREQLDGLIRKLYNKQQIVTLLTDDIDLFSDDELGKKLFVSLYYFNTNYALRVVLAGRNIFTEWADEKLPPKNILENLNQPFIQLEGIPLLSIKSELAHKPQIAHRLVELCGGHPYCLWELADGDILDGNFSDNDTLERINIRAYEFGIMGKWHKLFSDYWETTYSIAAHSLCYMLATSPNGLHVADAKAIMLRSGFTESDVISALNCLERTAILIPDEIKTRLRLIEIFAQWYKTRSGYRDGLQPVSVPPTVFAPPTPETPSTELTFLPEKDIVVIRRGHYHSFSPMGIKIRFLIDFPEQCTDVPAVQPEKFRQKISRLSRDLQDAFEDLDWFATVVQTADAHMPLRFIIPENMMGFPWEFLPLDDTGTRQIGTETPISRHLLKQGRYIDRPPLELPLFGKQKLRVLVVAAELRSDILVDAQGQVYSASLPNGTDLFLGRLQLADQISHLQSIFNAQSDFVDATFLAFGSTRSATRAEFEIILQSQQFDLLHFAGHGIYSDDFRGLVFADGTISLDHLNGLLESQKKLRFIFLNCCDSGQTDTNPYINNLLGLAQTCIEAGIPAVASMRWSIPVGVANVLAKAFYPAFFSEGLLDKAMLTAIKELKKQKPALNVYSLAPILLMH